MKTPTFVEIKKFEAGAFAHCQKTGLFRKHEDFTKRGLPPLLVAFRVGWVALSDTPQTPSAAYLVRPEHGLVGIHSHAGKILVPISRMGVCPVPVRGAGKNDGCAIDACSHSHELVVKLRPVLMIGVAAY